MGESMSLTPRAWVAYSGVSIDDFTDTVNARVSFYDPVRLTGGLGAVAETTYSWEGRTLSLRGSADLEHMLDGVTTTDVSGENLSFAAEKSTALLALSGVYSAKDFSLGVEASLRQAIGSSDRDYAGRVTFDLSF